MAVSPAVSNERGESHDHGPRRRRSGLTTKITLTILFILGFCVLLIGFLNYFNFDKTFSALIAERYTVVDKELRNSVEYGLRLGLSLAEIKNIQDIIEQTKRHYPSIDEIAVFNTHGKRIFDTRRDLTGKPVPAAWLPPTGQTQDGRVRQGHEGAHYFVSASLFNSFDAPAGSVVVTYGRRVVQRADHAMLLYLGGMGALTLLVIALLVFVAVYLVTRRLKMALGHIEGTLRADTQSRAPPAMMHAPLLQAAFEAFSHKHKRIKELLGLAHSELERVEGHQRRDDAGDV